ncbi:hypothetical protein TIFTF001_039779 [Ficus carica]|uniref:Uncharacterized protein n=1 Tax=Ficus carica TaxID=3494 RepID=A0AA87Z7B9_FICCA|nr:hypothetical protein TIFTF001_039779 [Ficus carica]
MDYFVIVREERYRLVREVQYEYYMAPPQEDHVKTSERKRAKEKARADYQKKNYNQQVGHKGPYLPATAVNQGQYHHEGPYLRTDIAHQGHFQQANMRNQVPPLKKRGSVMDCNIEAAKLLGGVVNTDYGRNKFTLRA